MTDVARIESAFQKACAALDEAWRLVREAHQTGMPWKVDTLSTSLADPRATQVEATLSSAGIVIHGDDDRAALIAVARACHAQGLIGETATARLVKEFSK